LDELFILTYALHSLGISLLAEATYAAPAAACGTLRNALSSHPQNPVTAHRHKVNLEHQHLHDQSLN